MTPQGKKIWNSPKGASLMAAMLGEKEVEPQHEATVKELVETSKAAKAKSSKTVEPNSDGVTRP